MMRTGSWLKAVALGLVGAPAFALFIWYGVSFLVHLSELKSLAAQGQEIKASANPAFYKLAVLGETKDRIRSYALRQAYWSLVAEKEHGSTLSSHLNNLLWLASSHIHLNEDEVFGLWVECSLYGCGHGLMDASNKYFRKPINALTVEELAGLVALVKSPAMFAPGTTRGEERKLMILGKYHEGS